jgi:hypothetical protein
MNTPELAPDAAQAPAGSLSPDPNDTPPAASVPADAAAAPAVDSEAPANGVTPESPPDSGAPAAARTPKPERIKELIAERNFWRERAVTATPAKPAEPETPPVPEGPPTLEQFGHDTEKWSQAFTAYHDKRSAQVVGQHLSREREAEQQRATAEAFVSRETQFAVTQPDYADVVSDPSLQQYVTPVISEAIVASENGPQLSYYLGTHRDELATIAKMRPVQQAQALGRLEAKLQSSAAAPPSAPKPRTVQPTRAPAPPSPVGNGSAPTKGIEQMSIGEYMEHRRRWSNQA